MKDVFMRFFCAVTFFFIFFVIAAPAGAAQFYLHNVDKDSILVSQPATIVIGADNIRTVDITKIFGGFGVYMLDISKMQINCQNSSWLLVSELLYTLPERTNPVNKTHLDDGKWTILSPQSLGGEIVKFICTWPKVSLQPEEVMEAADLWAAAEIAGAYFEEMLAKEIDEEEKQSE